GSIGLDHTHLITMDRTGWPFVSLSGEYWSIENQGSYHGAIAVPEAFIVKPQGWWYPWPPCRFFSITPILPGFALNTALYALILFALYATPGFVRRRIRVRRARRGQCPA